MITSPLRCPQPSLSHNVRNSGLENNVSILNALMVVYLSLSNNKVNTTPINATATCIKTTAGSPNASTRDRNVRVDTNFISQLSSDAKDTTCPLAHAEYYF